MQILFSPDGNAMSCSWVLGNFEGNELSNTEYWERVEMPDPRKPASNLNTQQKVEGVKESDLPQSDDKPKQTDKPKEQNDKGKGKSKTLALR